MVIESSDGMFGDGDGEFCISCGMPGSVVVDEDPAGDGDEIAYVAYWREDDEGRCTDATCSECAPSLAGKVGT